MDILDVSAELADQRFELKFPALGLTSLKGEQVRRFFIDRTNLLRDPTVERVDFTHLERSKNILLQDRL